MPQDRTAKKTELPAVSMPGVVLAITSIAPGEQMYGMIDVEVTFAGTHLCDHLELYVDGKLQGERLTHLRRNRYIQPFDTAEFYDGIHQLAVAALDARGDVLASAFVTAYFRNLMGFNIISMRPNTESTGYLAYLKLNTPRAELPASAYVCIDRFAEEREKLDSSVSYHERWNGTPVAKLELKRPDGAELVTGTHRLRLSIHDNQGSPLTFTDHKILV